MTTSAPAPDPTMAAIGAAVEVGRAGEIDTARATLERIWTEIGVLGDPLHRCTLAHYLADLYDQPAQALVWDVRALDAADAATDERVQAHQAGLALAGFYPSLHLNLADDHRRLGSFAAAAAHLDQARAHAPALADDAYGGSIRSAIDGVGEAIARRDTARREH